MKKETKTQTASAAVKKLLSILLAFTMLFSITSAIPITAEAATYSKISALKVPRIYQQAYSTFGGGDCNFDSVASVQAYVLSLQKKSYTYGGVTRSYSYGKDYKATNSSNNKFEDPICQKMYSLSGGTVDPTSILGKLPIVNMTKASCTGNNTSTYEKIYNQLKQGKPVVVHATGAAHAGVVIAYTKDSSTLSAANFTIMEITQGGGCWKNSVDNFNKYANSPQSGQYPSSCYRTLQSWLNDNGKRTINQIYYPTSMPSTAHTLSVYYNVNGGSISSSTYKSVNNLVYKTSTNAKFSQTWTYNKAQKDGLYNAKTFGLYRDGYTFVGWGTTSTGGKIFDQDDTSVLPTDINSNVKSKDCSTTLYAIWKPVHTHNYNWYYYTINPTCTEGGYTIYQCSCGDSYTGNYTYATGHSYNSGKITKQPTVTATGIKTYTCQKCGATRTETIPATGLKAPTVKAVVNANGGFTISWNAVAGADKYDVYVDNGTGYQLLRTVTGTSTTTGTAQYGKKYSYKVKAISSKDNVASVFSNTVTATNNKKLQTPTAKAVVNANGGFTISWNAVAGADKYDVYVDNGTGYQLLRTVTGKSTTTGTAQYGKKYSYKVRAVTSKNSSATSSYSNVVSATNTKKLQTPAMKATVNSNGSFKLYWNAVAGATAYELYIKQADGTYKLMKTTTSTSFTTAVAAYGKQYSYKMRAVTSKNSSATSAYSSVVNATNNKKLQTPTLKVAVNANGSFKLSWNAVAGATSYQLYIKQADGSYKLMKTTTGTSFTTAVAAKGKTYSYKVRAVTNKNSSATSNYSNVVSTKRK